MDVNSVLDFRILTSHQFNKIPRIETQQHDYIPGLLGTLLQIWKKYSIGVTFAPHLLHRHFDMPSESLILNQALKNDPRVHVSGVLPVSSLEKAQLQPDLLYLNEDGKWQGYEYQLSPPHEWNVDFLKDVRTLLLDQGLNDVVALSSSPQTDTRMEFGMDSHGSFTVPIIRNKFVAERSVVVEWRMETGPVFTETKFCVTVILQGPNGPYRYHHTGYDGQGGARSRIMEDLIEEESSSRVDEFIGYLKSEGYLAWKED
jgi:hypothetical protein